MQVGEPTLAANPPGTFRRGRSDGGAEELAVAANPWRDAALATEGVPWPPHDRQARWRSRSRAAAPELRPAFRLAYDTGMRKDEVSLLTWKQVCLTDAAIVALRGVPRHLTSPYVFVNPETGKPWSDLLGQFQRACQAAGVEGVWFHDLRRSFVTNARRRGVAESVVMRMSGHKTRSVFDRCNVVDDADVRAAGGPDRGGQEEGGRVGDGCGRPRGAFWTRMGSGPLKRRKPPQPGG